MTKTATQIPHVENYFGGCPVCGQTDGYENIGPDHWFVCDEHKTKWFIGSNLLSSWKDETEAEWEGARQRIEHYLKVKPLPMTLTEEEKRELQESLSWLEEMDALDKGFGVICGPNGQRAVDPGENPFELLFGGEWKGKKS